MQSSQIPSRVPVPFASNADPQYVAPVPQSTTVPGRASMQTGFPPANFDPIASGGIPPFGQDMNGILLLVTQWLRWQGAGAPVGWDAGYSASIGGYPKGAALAAANGLGWWVSLVESNVSNPDAGGADWALLSVDQVSSGNPNTRLPGSAPTAQSPPSLAWDNNSMSFWWCSTSGNAATAQWTRVAVLEPVEYNVGNTKNYTAADINKVVARSNAGAAMSDALPGAGTVENGWHVKIENRDPSGVLTITAAVGTTLNGVAAGFVQLRQNQTVEITGDGSTGFLVTQVPVPVVFSAQAIYVNSSGTYAPGVYHVDTRGGSFVFTLELGGTLGDNYTIKDVGGALAASPVLIDPNGATIEGFVGQTPMDVSWSELTLSLQSGNWSIS